MCSSTRGPAMVPFLVTCPTRKVENSCSFVSFSSEAVLSRTWLTDPGALERSGR